MRVLFHHRILADDGQAVHVRAMLRAFARAGHDVIEAALVPKGPRFAPERTGERPNAGIRVLRSIRSSRPWLRELAEYGYSAAALPWLLPKALATRPDLVYERYAFANAAGALVARSVGAPLVLEVNSPLLQELSATRGVAFPRAGRRLERFVWRSATVVCVVSRVLAELVESEGVDADRIVVTPNGVDDRIVAPADPVLARAEARAALGLPRATADGGVVVGFFGYPREWHRLGLALRALAQEGVRDVHLVIVGAGVAAEKLRRSVARQSLDARVHFREPVPWERVPGLLAGIDIGLLPGVPPYASPLKLVEYLAAGVPVLAPDQANVRELVTHGESGLLFAPDDPEALAAELARLAEGPELRRALGERGRKTVVDKELTWQANVRRVLEAVARVSAGRPQLASAASEPSIAAERSAWRRRDVRPSADAGGTARRTRRLSR